MERRRRQTDPIQETLLPQAILADRQRPAVGADRHACLDQVKRLGRNVLKFVSHDIDAASEGRERFPVAIVRGGGHSSDFACRRHRSRLKDMRAQSEPGRRHRKHAPKLSAAQYADGLARRQSVTRHGALRQRIS